MMEFRKHLTPEEWDRIYLNEKAREAGLTYGTYTARGIPDDVRAQLKTSARYHKEEKETRPFRSDYYACATYVCLYCGALLRGRKDYCSQECRMADLERQDEELDKERPKYIGLIQPRNCRRCGKEFQPTHANAKMCSKMCAYLSNLESKHKATEKYRAKMQEVLE